MKKLIIPVLIKNTLIADAWNLSRSLNSISQNIPSLNLPPGMRYIKMSRPFNTSMETLHTKTNETYYHGTKANLSTGDLIMPGYSSNYGQRKSAKYIYLTATLDAAIWGAELAQGDGPERIYIVEPTGEIEDDPNLTDKKFPGNPTKSYRSKLPFRVIGEVAQWQSHTAEQLSTMKQHLERLKEQGVEAIEE